MENKEIFVFFSALTSTMNEIKLDDIFNCIKDEYIFYSDGKHIYKKYKEFYLDYQYIIIVRKDTKFEDVTNLCKDLKDNIDSIDSIYFFIHKRGGAPLETLVSIDNNYQEISNILYNQSHKKTQESSETIIKYLNNLAQFIKEKDQENFEKYLEDLKKKFDKSNIESLKLKLLHSLYPIKKLQESDKVKEDLEELKKENYFKEDIEKTIEAYDIFIDSPKDYYQALTDLRDTILKDN